ncbi:hypothetical protein M9Y10_033720 [Tritrichomonas musculus]|uniref:Uncharacterized protein n=1 Tax=Tritrichomonas musculus TaxID=1915356 RepID=A0ABR2GL16_9EUKA
MLQPLIWKFPVISLHLTQSLNGHFSLHEEEDMSILFKIINEHEHFEARYFAADGITALDQFHEAVFELYEKYLDDLINGYISLEDFLKTVKTLCKIFPILDLLT